MKDPFDNVHQYVEALLNGRKPKRFRVQNEQDLRALQLAARLAGERDEQVGPSADFVAALQARLVTEATGKQQPRSSRRNLLAAALSGLAAGVAGFAGGRLTAPATPTPEPPPQVAPSSKPAMVRDNGQWFAVAKLSEMRPRQVVRFTAGAVEGHLVRSGNMVYALSAICSHLPCTLTYRWGSDDFLCPCHEVSFNMSGEAVNTRRTFDPLTTIQVKIDGDEVMVWSIGDPPKSHPASAQFD